MSWAKLDDGFWMHPKTVMAGNEAAGIFARCLSYAAAHSRSGQVPLPVALDIAGSRRKLDAVIDAGLLARQDDDVVVPDFARLRGPVHRPKVPRWLRTAVIERDGPTCQLCGQAVQANDIHIDHVVPLVHGGPTNIDNLQVAHSICNIRKGTGF